MVSEDVIPHPPEQALDPQVKVYVTGNEEEHEDALAGKTLLSKAAPLKI